MRRIKSFRLFESGEDKLEGRIADISGIYEDAKTIEPDEDYVIPFGKIGDDISDLIRDNSFSGDGTVFHHDFLKPVNICINVLGIGGKLFNEVNSTTVDKIKGDMSRFKTLLEEHLDYLPEGSVTLYDAGWIGNYKINIKIT